MADYFEFFLIEVSMTSDVCDPDQQSNILS